MSGAKPDLHNDTVRFIIENFDTKPNMNPYIISGISELLKLSASVTSSWLVHNKFPILGNKDATAILSIGTFIAMETSTFLDPVFDKFAKTLGDAALQYADEEETDY